MCHQSSAIFAQWILGFYASFYETQTILNFQVYVRANVTIVILLPIPLYKIPFRILQEEPGGSRWRITLRNFSEWQKAVRKTKNVYKKVPLVYGAEMVENLVNFVNTVQKAKKIKIKFIKIKAEGILNVRFSEGGGTYFTLFYSLIQKFFLTLLTGTLISFHVECTVLLSRGKEFFIQDRVEGGGMG